MPTPDRVPASRFSHCPDRPEHRGRAAATPITAVQAVLAVSLLAMCPLAQAQSATPEPADGFSGRVGLGVATVPSYEGSPNRRTLLAPDLSISYRSQDWGTVQFSERGIFWNAWEHGAFRLALVTQFDLGRQDKKPSRWNLIPGDQRLAGMGEVKGSTEAGVGVGYGPVMLVARQSLGNKGSRGTQADLTVDYPVALSDRLSLRLSAGATWADRDYMQTYFGVSAAQAQATSFSEYQAKSGCRKVEVGIGAEYAMAANWKLQGNVGFSRLGSEAAASPLVGKRNGVSAMVGVAREF